MDPIACPRRPRWRHRSQHDLPQLSLPLSPPIMTLAPPLTAPTHQPPTHPPPKDGVQPQGLLRLHLLGLRRPPLALRRLLRVHQGVPVHVCHQPRARGQVAGHRRARGAPLAGGLAVGAYARCAVCSRVCCVSRMSFTSLPTHLISLSQPPNQPPSPPKQQQTASTTPPPRSGPSRRSRSWRWAPTSCPTSSSRRWGARCGRTSAASRWGSGE